MSAPSQNYQLAYPSGNAVNSFTLHDATGAIVTPASITPVDSSGYTAVGTATFSGSDPTPSGSPITLTAPGNYRLSTTGTFNDTGKNVDVMINGVNKLNLSNTNTPTATIAVTQADIDAGGVVAFQQNQSWFAANIAVESFSAGDGWDRKNITLSEATELIAVTPVFANPAAPVPVYLTYDDAGTLKNVLDNSVFTVANPGRPAPHGGQENAYTGVNGVWTLKTPTNFDAKIKPRTKDPITGVPLFGNDFLMLWTGTNPTAIQVQVDVEDITDPAGFFEVDYTNATTYSESSVGMSMVKLTEEIIPRDGLTHALKFRIRYNCGGDVSAWVEDDWKTAVYKLAPPEAPASVSATLIRDRVDVIPDRVRVNWTWAASNPGDVVEVYAIDFLGKKHLIYEESDNAVSSCTVENVSRFYKVEQPPAVQTAYRFGVLAKNRSSKSDLTISAVVQITSTLEDVTPPTPDEIAGTAEDVTFPGLIQKFTAEVNADNSLTAENRLVITGVAYPLVRDLFRALRKVIMTGGSVTVEDIGVFKAKWSSERMGRNPSNGESVLIPAARGVGLCQLRGVQNAAVDSRRARRRLHAQHRLQDRHQARSDHDRRGSQGAVSHGAQERQRPCAAVFLGERPMTIERMTVNYTPDGDTLKAFRTIGHSAEEVRIRLAYIDAPELTHPACTAYAVSARAYLRRLLALREAINVTVLGQDAYGRLVGEVRRVRDDGNCGLRLLVSGYVALWNCPQSRGEYYAAQDIAQRKRLGIWKTDGSWQAPWRYR